MAMWFFRVTAFLWVTSHLGTSTNVKVPTVEVTDSGINNKSTCSTSCLNSRCHFNNSRETCTDGCEEGRRGDNCSVDCPPKCSDCNKYTGDLCDELCLANCEGGCDRYGWHCASCKPGFKGRFCDTCVKGFTGIHCNETCPEYCYDGCERDSGFCYWRDEAYRGRYCGKTSSTLCHTCSRRTGKCKLCNVGYDQASCEKCAPRCSSCVRRATVCLGCIHGYWGEKCTLSCPANCERCDMNTGECLWCITGYRGEHCNLTCPSNCDQCYREIELCWRCTDGYWGDRCSLTCPTNCDLCYTETGLCRQCTDGYWGDRCSLTCPTNCVSCKTATGQCTACRNGYRGKYCNISCSPLCNLCDQVTGDCYGCKTGYQGGYCNETCPSNCKGGCDRYTGTCDTCVDGYAGRHCFSTCSSDCEICEFDTGQCLECRPGFRGKYCACSDKCYTCDEITGQCEHCTDGWKGQYCNESCPKSCTQCARYGKSCKGPCVNDSFYGESCSIPCPEVCAGCEKTTGSCVECAQGYSRLYCTEMCTLCTEPKNCISNQCLNRDTQWLWIGLVGTLVTCCTIAASVVVWIKHTRKLRRADVGGDEQRLTTDLSDVHEYHMPSNHYYEIDHTDRVSDPVLESDFVSHPLSPPLPSPRTQSKKKPTGTMQLDSDVPASSSVSRLPTYEDSLSKKNQEHKNPGTETTGCQSSPPPPCPRPKVTINESHKHARQILQEKLLQGADDVKDSPHHPIPPRLLQPSLSQRGSHDMILIPSESKAIDSDQLSIIPSLCRLPKIPNRESPSRKTQQGKTNQTPDYAEDSPLVSLHSRHLSQCGLASSNQRNTLQESTNLDSDEVEEPTPPSPVQHCSRSLPPRRRHPRNPKRKLKEVQEPIHPFMFEADEVFENPLYIPSAVSSKNAYEMVELNLSNAFEEHQGYKSTVNQFEVEWRNLQSTWPATETTQHHRLLHRSFSDSYLLRFDSKSTKISNTPIKRSISEIISRANLKFDKLNYDDGKFTYISPVTELI